MTDTSQPFRRTYQFSLRSLFVVVGLCSISIAMLVAYLTAGGHVDGRNGVDAWQLREEAIVTSVKNFRAELAALSATYAELQGVGNADCSYLGFSFVNDSISPRLHIALGVEDGDADNMQPVPAGGFDELRDVHALTYLQVECEGNDELKRQIDQLYNRFQAELRDSLSEVNASVSRRQQ